MGNNQDSEIVEAIARTQERINKANNGDNVSGRSLMTDCIQHLRNRDPLPDLLHDYLVETLAAGMSASYREVADKMHITKPSHRTRGRIPVQRIEYLELLFKISKEDGIENMPRGINKSTIKKLNRDLQARYPDLSTDSYAYASLLANVIVEAKLDNAEHDNEVVSIKKLKETILDVLPDLEESTVRRWMADDLPKLPLLMSLLTEPDQ